MKLKITILILITLTIRCTSYGPGHATNHTISDKKQGAACKSWLFTPSLPFTWGRNDIFSAATTANISKITVVDSSSTSYLLYGKNCTVVYGE
ncbi:MAG: hypothetical protein IT287_02545 [Bdellovibrionaceae bacterium]|nr:hypothetical protein [Pseudobdellovibrionaceae bacterium]